MKVSLIIPIYNVKTYLERTLQSVISQIIDDMEILLIDDGSSDGSEEICDCYSEKYKFIKVYHKKNDGVAVARNYGIEKASGKYVMFLDSDDLLAEGALKIIDTELENDEDMFCFGYEKIDKDDNLLNEYSSIVETGIYDKNIFLEKYYNKEKTFPWVCWQNIFKRQIIINNQVCFPKGIKVAEDTEFYITYLSNIEKIKFISTPIIRYRINREGSLMTEMKCDSVENVFEVYSRCFYNGDDFMKKYFANFYVGAFLYLLKVQKEEDRNYIISKIDRNIVKEAKSVKSLIFRILTKCLGIKMSLKLSELVKKKRLK